VSRRRARELAMQAIYQWQLNQMLVPELIGQFVETNDMQKVDFNHFKELVAAAVDRTPELDAMLTPLLDRKLDELDPIELAILRLSSFEMKNRLDIPYRVVINEGVELAKKYGASDGHKYVNGILDKLATDLRHVEKNS
jgi:N utilization substance protein B